MSVVLADILKRNSNNFDLVRLVAAFGVIWGHTFAQQKGAPFGEPTIAFFNGLEYSGSWAVYAFFLTSGILITMSMDRLRSPWRYSVLRFFRIWPALALSTLIVFFVTVPLSQARPYMDTVSDPVTLDCALRNVQLLRGLCLSNPTYYHTAQAVTGINWSLWTLPLEVHCYLVVLLLGMLGLFRHPALLSAAIGATVLAFLVAAKFVPALGSEQMFYGDFQILGGYSFYPMVVFFVGALMYLYRQHIVIDWRLAIASLVLYFVLRDTKLEASLMYLAFFTTLLAIAGSKFLAKHVHLKYDYSYGVFIYSFPVGQALGVWLPDIGFFQLMALDALLSLGFAIFSCHLIERPAMKLSRHLTGSPKNLREEPATPTPESSGNPVETLSAPVAAG